ncbi:MAG: ABC transporter permease, partial [Lysobacteraceae bacterium]
MVVADLRRRTREPRFWWLCAMLVVGAWFCLPAAGDNAGMRVTVGDARAFYSSAWIGMTLALCGSMLITLVGFYAVRGSIAHDIDSRSIELLMATPMTRAGYLLARFLGMLAVFGLFLVAMTLTGAVGQYVRGEVGEFRPFELVQPLLLITLPALAIAAAFAVWFDLVRGLRSTLGNVLYFFVWLGLLVAGALAGEASDPNGAAPGFAAVTIDVPGLSVLRTDIQPVRAEL